MTDEEQEFMQYDAYMNELWEKENANRDANKRIERPIRQEECKDTSNRW